jgi:hypothetical protein
LADPIKRIVAREQKVRPHDGCEIALCDFHEEWRVSLLALAGGVLRAAGDLDCSSMIWPRAERGRVVRRWRRPRTAAERMHALG